MKENNNFLTRHFNKIKKISNSKISKLSTHKEKLKDEYNWYKQLPSNLRKYTPAIFSFYEKDEYCEMIMELIPFENSFQMILNENKLETYLKLLTLFFDFLEEIKKTEKKKENFDDILITEFIYKEKTIDRLKWINEEELLNGSFEKIIFNNKELLPFSSIESEVFKLIDALLINKSITSIVHGDFFLSNILVSPQKEEIRVVDPRGRFSSKNVDIYGDLRYDIAKLSHSFRGHYDWIVANKYWFKQTENRFELKEELILSHSDQKIIDEKFKSIVQDVFGVNYQEILLIEGLLFLTMIPLHAESMEHQKIFYLKAVEIFNKMLNKE
ncbi:hypothetical protein [Mycoplasma procyoni]|uniref:hypothetical protein n=1 Tax=Mycoplasma procyoni TaxID=568784 RepID=UPI00197B27F7|nr:hypothetical protein [Mycoplasma procyoni]MBN3535094.1 hypothetical protein [Mycoplasma procyoni]